MTKTLFDPRDFGGRGDGVSDDWAALQVTLEATKATDGCFYLPPGTWRHSKPLTLIGCSRRIAMRGDGDNVSVLLNTGGAAGLVFTFEQEGQDQPFGLRIEGIGLRARGRCGTGLTVSYGAPAATSDHYQPSTVIRSVSIVSGNDGSWAHGIDIEAAWNVALTDVHVSGRPPAFLDEKIVWDSLDGNGVRFRKHCVNAHLTNVRMNFWAAGFFAHGEEDRNTEGIFFANCSMVGVKRGVWVKGHALSAAPRISTVTWLGGLIECRVAGVAGGSAAFHFEHVWTGLVQGCQMITETITENVENTYGVVAQDCHGVVVMGCDINAFIFGVATTGACKAISVYGNTFTNTKVQVAYNAGTERSRAYGNVRTDGDVIELNHCTPEAGNKIGFA